MWFSLFTSRVTSRFDVCLLEPLESRKLLSSSPAPIDTDGMFVPQPEGDIRSYYVNTEDITYNCHSLAWTGGQSDPDNPSTPFFSDAWINDIGPYVSQDHSGIVKPEEAQVGDVIVYVTPAINPTTGEPVLDANGNTVYDYSHSAVVTAVDENGLISEVTGKEGAGPITVHHPAPSDDGGHSGANPAYGEVGGIYRPHDPVELDFLPGEGAELGPGPASDWKPSETFKGEVRDILETTLKDYLISLHGQDRFDDQFPNEEDWDSFFETSE